MNDNRLELEATLAKAKTRRDETVRALQTIDAEIAELAARLAGLSADGGGIPAPISPAEKVALFRGLFRGRADVWPRLWQNPKSGKKGYAPVCGNEWRDGICGKPKVKCGECAQQAFLPVTDAVIRDHLQGKHVAGGYAMQPDETCAFLAADFDEDDWQQDVLAYTQAGRDRNVNVAVERSRSGNGAHAWIFFAEPVPAMTARKLGSLLLTAACAKHPKLSLKSYDRLFPSQDMMPKGGFGNLIALPLQRGPRSAGNSVFVDDRFAPIGDQWAYLACIQVVSVVRLEELVRDAERTDAVLGLPLWSQSDEEKPWLRQPSRATPIAVLGPLPAAIDVVLAQRCFVAVDGLPAALIDRLRRLAAFANPEFQRKQAMRLPTSQVPRIVACAEIDGNYVSLPRGCRASVERLATELQIPVHVTDKRMAGEPIVIDFQGELRPRSEPPSTPCSITTWESSLRRRAVARR